MVIFVLIMKNPSESNTFSSNMVSISPCDFSKKTEKKVWLFLVPLHKKKNFSINDFFSKCDQIRNFLMI